MSGRETARRAGELVGLMARAAEDVDAGRIEIVARHAGYRGFRAAVAEDGDRPAGFCYAYTSEPGQWWHEQVRAAIGADVARAVLVGALEIVELHVEPADQGQGLGRALLHAVASGAEPRAVLTTRTGNARARRLYASAGFEVLHDRLWARQDSPGAVVLVAPLPLPVGRAGPVG